MVVDPLAMASAISYAAVPRVTVDDLPNRAHGVLSSSTSSFASYFNQWGGDKYDGSFGTTKLYTANYWQLRARSDQLFNENLYARGLVRRLITAEINTGLTLEAEPLHELIPGLTEDAARDWGEEVESRFEIWARSPKLCDYERRRTYAELQEFIRRESMVSGDVLVVLRHSRQTPNDPPRIQVIRGSRVATPIDRLGEAAPRAGNKIVHGVELNARGEHVAYHVQDSFLKSTRIPVTGERSGKRMAWLVYGTDYRQDEVRGQPLLSLVLTSIKELDRYRDSEQRAATINSLLAMFIERQRPNVPTLPVSGGALRNDRINGTGLDGQPRQYNLANNYPGMVFEELAPGEIPHSFDTRRPNVNYQAFEEAVVAAIAWASEVPPEVLRLSFSSNYSASKAAINEFKSYITRVRGLFGANVCQPIYCEWLITEALANRVTNSQGLLASWRDASRFAEFGAWTRAEWGGPVKPSIELSKDVKAYGEAIELRLISRDRACKDLFGVRFSTVVRRVKKELELLEDIGGEGAADAQPDAQGGTPGGIPAAPSTPQTLTEARVLELIAEEIEENQPTPLREVS